MEKKCILCNSCKKDELRLGEFLTKNKIGVHAFCLYLTSNLMQRGEDDEGITGFLLDDIQKEARRIAPLKCCYCRKGTAGIGCCAPKCPRSFHLLCGLQNGAKNEFVANYQSFCDKHVTPIKYRPPSNQICGVCLEELLKPNEKFDQCNMLRSPCCEKGWFHKICLQQTANAAGYFFKCPLCNDCKKFRVDLSYQGISIPNRDATWELEENAFQDLLERPNTCAATKCRCKNGRQARNDTNPFIYCNICGSVAMHQNCLQTKQKIFHCIDCRQFMGEAKIPTAEESGRDDVMMAYKESEGEKMKTKTRNSTKMPQKELPTSATENLPEAGTATDSKTKRSEVKNTAKTQTESVESLKETQTPASKSNTTATASNSKATKTTTAASSSKSKATTTAASSSKSKVTTTASAAKSIASTTTAASKSKTSTTVSASKSKTTTTSASISESTTSASNSKTTTKTPATNSKTTPATSTGTRNDGIQTTAANTRSTVSFDALSSHAMRTRSARTRRCRQTNSSCSRNVNSSVKRPANKSTSSNPRAPYSKTVRSRAACNRRIFDTDESSSSDDDISLRNLQKQMKNKNQSESKLSKNVTDAEDGEQLHPDMPIDIIELSSDNDAVDSDGTDPLEDMDAYMLKVRDTYNNKAKALDSSNESGKKLCVDQTKPLAIAPTEEMDLQNQAQVATSTTTKSKSTLENSNQVEGILAARNADANEVKNSEVIYVSSDADGEEQPAACKWVYFNKKSPESFNVNNGCDCYAMERNNENDALEVTETAHKILNEMVEIPSSCALAGVLLHDLLKHAVKNYTTYTRLNNDETQLSTVSMEISSDSNVEDQNDKVREDNSCAAPPTVEERTDQISEAMEHQDNYRIVVSMEISSDSSIEFMPVIESNPVNISKTANSHLVSPSISKEVSSDEENNIQMLENNVRVLQRRSFQANSYQKNSITKSILEENIDEHSAGSNEDNGEISSPLNESSVAHRTRKKLNNRKNAASRMKRWKEDETKVMENNRNVSNDRCDTLANVSGTPKEAAKKSVGAAKSSTPMEDVTKDEDETIEPPIVSVNKIAASVIDIAGMSSKIDYGKISASNVRTEEEIGFRELLESQRMPRRDSKRDNVNLTKIMTDKSKTYDILSADILPVRASIEKTTTEHNICTVKTSVEKETPNVATSEDNEQIPTEFTEKLTPSEQSIEIQSTGSAKGNYLRNSRKRSSTETQTLSQTFKISHLESTSESVEEDKRITPPYPVSLISFDKGLAEKTNTQELKHVEDQLSAALQTEKSSQLEQRLSVSQDKLESLQVSTAGESTKKLEQSIFKTPDRGIFPRILFKSQTSVGARSTSDCTSTIEQFNSTNFASNFHLSHQSTASLPILECPPISQQQYIEKSQTSQPNDRLLGRRPSTSLLMGNTTQQLLSTMTDNTTSVKQNMLSSHNHTLLKPRRPIQELLESGIGKAVPEAANSKDLAKSKKISTPLAFKIPSSSFTASTTKGSALTRSSASKDGMTVASKPRLFASALKSKIPTRSPVCKNMKTKAKISTVKSITNIIPPTSTDFTSTVAPIATLLTGTVGTTTSTLSKITSTIHTTSNSSEISSIASKATSIAAEITSSVSNAVATTSTTISSASSTASKDSKKTSTTSNTTSTNSKTTFMNSKTTSTVPKITSTPTKATATASDIYSNKRFISSNTASIAFKTTSSATKATATASETASKNSVVLNASNRTSTATKETSANSTKTSTVSVHTSTGSPTKSTASGTGYKPSKSLTTVTNSTPIFTATTAMPAVSTTRSTTSATVSKTTPPTSQSLSPTASTLSTSQVTQISSSPLHKSKRPFTTDHKSDSGHSQKRSRQLVAFNDLSAADGDRPLTDVNAIKAKYTEIMPQQLLPPPSFKRSHRFNKKCIKILNRH